MDRIKKSDFIAQKVVSKIGGLVNITNELREYARCVIVNSV